MIAKQIRKCTELTDCHRSYRRICVVKFEKREKTLRDGLKAKTNTASHLMNNRKKFNRGRGRGNGKQRRGKKRRGSFGNNKFFERSDSKRSKTTPTRNDYDQSSQSQDEFQSQESAYETNQTRDPEENKVNLPVYS